MTILIWQWVNRGDVLLRSFTFWHRYYTLNRADTLMSYCPWGIWTVQCATYRPRGNEVVHVTKHVHHVHPWQHWGPDYRVYLVGIDAIGIYKWNNLYRDAIRININCMWGHVETEVPLSSIGRGVCWSCGESNLFTGDDVRDEGAEFDTCAVMMWGEE